MYSVMYGKAAPNNQSLPKGVCCYGCYEHSVWIRVNKASPQQQKSAPPIVLASTALSSVRRPNPARRNRWSSHVLYGKGPVADDGDVLPTCLARWAKGTEG